MKVCILSPSQDGSIDGPVHSLLRQIPNRVDSPQQADVTLVPITRFDSFRFNQDLISQLNGKRWALVDYSEFGWQWDQSDSYLWGRSRMTHPAFRDNAEYHHFNQFVIDHTPILTFQRELLKKDVGDRLLPIEYTSWLPEHGNDTRDEFLSRPLEVLFNWGRSHEGRMMLHGSIFQQAGDLGFDVLGSWDQIDKAIAENPKSKKWVSIYAPSFCRIDVLEVQRLNRKAKASVIMPGAGVKTFRHGECCGDGLLAMPDSELAWSYPWDASNSIQFQPVTDIESATFAVHIIHKALQRPDIYEIYASAMDNSRNYRWENFLQRHVLGNIRRVL